jgi:hypothetical protein
VFSVPLWLNKSTVKINHGGTENTEVAQSV